jgi:hypothetical protein
VRSGVALVGHQPIDWPSLQLVWDHRALSHTLPICKASLHVL